MHDYFRNDDVLVKKKVKTPNKYCNASIWTPFSAKFIIETKVKKSAFWNIQN